MINVLSHTHGTQIKQQLIMDNRFELKAYEKLKHTTHIIQSKVKLLETVQNAFNILSAEILVHHSIARVSTINLPGHI